MQRSTVALNMDGMLRCENNLTVALNMDGMLRCEDDLSVLAPKERARPKRGISKYQVNTASPHRLVDLDEEAHY